GGTTTMAAVRELWQPPHAIDAERGVLGALLYEPKAWTRIVGRVQPADFVRPEHVVLFETIAIRAARRESVDAASIAATIVRDRATLRRLHDAGNRIVRLVRNPDERPAGDLLADATAILQSLAGKSRVGAGLVDARTLVEALVDDIERRRDGHRGLSVGLP